MESTIERWYSMKEICEYLGVSRDTVLAWIEKRNMPAAKIGRLWKFKISEVDAWMKSGVAADEGHTDYIDEKLNTTRSIDEIFRNAQRAFNTWSKWKPCDRTTENPLKMLDFDFFEVLDSVTIARSRKHIQKYYDMADIGTFPTRLKPISLRPHLTDLKEAISYNEIFEQLMLLTLTIYTPTHYILPSKMEKYAELYGDNKVNVGFTQANREQGIRRLTAINLMKRMESSVYSFNLTLTRIKDLINSTIETIDRFDKHSGTTLDLTDISDMDEFDAEDQNSDELFSFGRKVKIDLADMDYVSWRNSLAKDSDVLELLTLLVGDITPEHDSKLQELFRVIDNKITHPINENNKKLIIFTAFTDTAGYLYDNVSRYVKDKYGLNTAMVSGTVEGRTTCPKLRADLNTVLTCFSPISKDKELLMPGDKTEIDVLIATDCISEGQNLQDCDYLINYDIHWNPVRIIQRFGRIDRIGSRNKVIQHNISYIFYFLSENKFLIHNICYFLCKIFHEISIYSKGVSNFIGIASCQTQENTKAFFESPAEY